MTKLIPNWLHCELLRFAWYRRKCGIPEVSAAYAEITRETLRVAQDCLSAAASLNAEYEAGVFDHLKAGTIKIRKPAQYVQRSA
jgi:hypothetical protein